MREIKFRVFNKATGKMVNDPLVNGIGHVNYIFQNDSDQDCIWMQFTGLHDREGREVFEGDIIKYPNTNFGYGDPKQPEYITGVLRDISYLFGDELWINICRMGTVIGNVHEHPDLVK